MERISTFFTDWWVPAIWLSPTINIWEQNGTVRITDWALYEIAWGFYWYNFDNYSNDKVYLYRIDGWDVLADSDRYVFGNNELDSYSFKYSRGRTAAPIANYTPRFDSIEKKFLEIPAYDDSEIKKSLKKIEKLFPKKEKDIVSPVLIDIQKNLKSIENLIWTIWSTNEIIKLWESLNILKNKLTREIQDIEKTSSKMLERWTQKMRLDIESKIDQLPDTVIDRDRERTLRDSDNEVLSKLSEMENDDKEVLEELDDMEKWDKEALEELSVLSTKTK